MWCPAHGKAAQSGAQIASECTPSDELPRAKPVRQTRPHSDRDAKGRFRPRHGVALALERGAPKGMLKKLSAQAPHDWQIVRRYGRTACRHRISELARIHGDLSAGVCALLLDGYDQRADARYIRALAAAEFGQDDEPQPQTVGRPPTKGRPGMIELLRLSIQLSAGARQAERDAWELASREAEARRLNEAAARQPADLSALLTAGESALPQFEGNSDPRPPFDPPGGSCARGAPPSNSPPSSSPLSDPETE